MNHYMLSPDDEMAKAPCEGARLRKIKESFF